VKRRVAVIFGGRSAEHEVSVVSARSVVEALDPERYEIVPIGIDKEGRWHLLPEIPTLVEGSKALPAVSVTDGMPVALAREPGERSVVSATGEPAAAFDVVFPVLHGPFGEDGTVQGLLELAGIPYVGAGVLASAVGMDKAVQKTLFKAAGLPIVPHLVVTEKDWKDDPEEIEARAEALGYPLFVKPASLGSSVGITKVKQLDQLEAALREAFSHGRKAVIEKGMEGLREIEVAVLGNEDPVASLPGEIIPTGEFYDYTAKYLDGNTVLEVPAKLRPETVEALQRAAVSAFRTIDCEGMARVDFFVREPDDLYVNEINTIPGFTSVSMYPLMWQASGLTYPELVDRLIELALERHDREARRTGSVTEPEGGASNG
jgi:D-alanine-D-alanine ligase